MLQDSAWAPAALRVQARSLLQSPVVPTKGAPRTFDGYKSEFYNGLQWRFTGSLNVLVVGVWGRSGDEQYRDQQDFLISSTLQEQEVVLLLMNDRAVGRVRMVMMLPLARA
ncbi:hypothetical protein FOXYSP1_14788 [Fusarium oxysporum f. sp. phaseoli]